MDIETVVIKVEPTWEADGGPSKPEVPRARSRTAIRGKRKSLNNLQSDDAAYFNKEKKRSDNWTLEDKKLLKSLVKQREEIIENKLTDTGTNERKVAAWTDLQNNFNLFRNGPPRTISQLRVQWGSLKTAEKRRASYEKLRQNNAQPQDDSDGLSRSQEDYESDSDSNRPDGLGVGPDEITVVPDTHTIQISPLERRREVPRAGLDMGAHAHLHAGRLEARCVAALHRAQMANERRRARNLDLEERLLTAKILHFQKKTRELP